MRPTATPSARHPGGIATPATRTVPVADLTRAGPDDRARTRRTSLHLPHDLPLAAWLRLGQQLRSVRDASAWWAGDWFVHGSRNYPERYREGIRSMALDYQTLRNYAWVARKFAPSRRRQELSFQHHQEVAALPPDQQDLWLGRSVAHGWSKAELRRRLRAAAAGGGVPTEPVARLELLVTEARRTRWQRAADRERQDLAEWLTRLADRAALRRP